MEPPMSLPTSSGVSPPPAPRHLHRCSRQGAGEIPGIVRATEDVIIRLPIGQHGRHIGFAHEDSASCLHTLRRRGIKIGLGLSKGRETRRGFNPLTLIDSLRVIGKPSSGASAPRARAASAASAASRACSSTQ